jgi:hypothetical protein
MNGCKSYIIKSLPILALSFLTYSTNAQWIQVEADIEAEAGSDHFGESIAISADGQTVAVGATFNDGAGPNAGHVRVFKLFSGNWIQQGADIDGSATNNYAGHAVSLSADGLTLAVGSPRYQGVLADMGRVRIYQLISGVWVQQGQHIEGEAGGDQSGWSVSLSNDGQTVAIGARDNDANGSGSGQVRVFKYISNAWVQQGADIDGLAAGDIVGTANSLSGDGLTVAVPSYTHNNSGHVRIFKYISNVWVQQGAEIVGEAAVDDFGWSVSLSDDGLTLAIGAKGNDGNGSNAGHVRVFNYTSGNWVQQGADIDGEASVDRSGYSVSLSADGSTVAIGATQNDGSALNAGHVRVYKFVSGAWVLQGADIDGEADSDFSGFSVALSSDGLTVAVGAPYNDGIGVDAGHARVYTLSSVGIESIELNALASVHPNPTSGNVTIAFAEQHKNLEINIRNALGQLVSTHQFKKTNNVAVELPGERGVYFIEIANKEGKRTTLRALKK